jgi:hypothetical protein
VTPRSVRADRCFSLYIGYNVSAKDNPSQVTGPKTFRQPTTQTTAGSSAVDTRCQIIYAIIRTLAKHINFLERDIVMLGGSKRNSAGDRRSPSQAKSAPKMI